MKHSTIYLIIFFLAISSCSESDTSDYDSIEINFNITDLLVYEMASENDSTLAFLKRLTSSDKLGIGDVRIHSLQNLFDLKEQLIKYCGGRDNETGVIIRPQEKKLVSEFMIKLKKGAELKKSLNMIIVFINKYNENLSNIAREPNEIPTFRDDPYQSKLTFVGVHFGNTNLASALGIISSYEAYIVQKEYLFLNGLLKEQLIKSL